MADFQGLLYKLNKHLSILNERKAKYAGNAPLELLNQIEDHEQAITLTRQVITGELTEAEWREALEPLLISVTEQTGEAVQQRIPLQRPPRAEHFTNRDQELAQLLADLRPGRVVTLCGPGGIGKSALAAEAVWTLAPADDPPDRFPDGVIFHSFSSQPQAEVALENIARIFGEEPKPTPAAAAQRALAGRRALLFLDGTEVADNLPTVLEIRSGCGVLVTSRSRKDAQAERQDIEPLASDEAVKLLQAWSQGQADDETVLKRISNLVGRVPLGLRLVGRYLEQTGEMAAEYLEWLEEAPIEALSPGERREENVALLLGHSLDQVNETARQVLQVVGILALTPFDREVIAAALAISPNHLRQPLNQLVNYGLLLRTGQHYEVSHALIHTYAKRRLGEPDEALKRMATYYATLVEAQSQLKVAGFTKLDMNRAHIIAVLNKCIEQEDWSRARRLAWTVGEQYGYLHRQGHWTEWVVTSEAGLKAAQNLGQRKDEETFFNNLGLAYWSLGQVETAIGYFKQALAISQKIGNRPGEGVHLGNLGLAHRDLGQVTDAIEYYVQALTISREIEDRHSEGAWLGSLGLAYRDQGQVETAIGYFKQALAISQEIGNRQGEGIWLGNLGTASRHLEKIETAIEYHQQALTISHEIGDRRYEAGWQGNLGTDYLALRQVDTALVYYEQALAISREIGDRRKEAQWLAGLGRAYSALGQVEQAKRYLLQSLEILEDIKSPNAEQVKRDLAEFDEK
jgi:tetratricopeptide (TPR) repeat protein